MLVCIYEYYVFMHLLYTYISVMNASMHIRVLCIYAFTIYIYISVMNASMHIRVLCIYAITIYIYIRYEC
jgi:hypothetical protein